MPGCTSFLCPGSGAIWIANPINNPGGAADQGTVCGIPTAGSWVKLPHTQTVSLTPDREDPSEIRTDDTDGVKVKVCAGATSWSVDVTSVLCLTDWLWCYLFPTRASTACPSGAGLTPEYLDVSSQSTLYFYLSPNNNYIQPDGNAASPYGGVYFLGFPEVGDFGWDNDDNDPLATDWNIEVSAGPWFQPCVSNSLKEVTTDWIPT